MAATSRAPKQWSLKTRETLNSFENWKHNLIYTLSLDPNFAPFVVEGIKWEKKTKANPLHGFGNDGEPIPGEYLAIHPTPFRLPDNWSPFYRF